MMSASISDRQVCTLLFFTNPSLTVKVRLGTITMYYILFTIYYPDALTFRLLGKNIECLRSLDLGKRGFTALCLVVKGSIR